MNMYYPFFPVHFNFTTNFKEMEFKIDVFNNFIACNTYCEYVVCLV